MKFLAWPFVILATAGFVISIYLHFLSLLGIPSPIPENDLILVFVGVFVVWGPAVIISRQLTADYPQRDFWKAALRGCPTWMRYGVNIFTAYALLLFLLFMLLHRETQTDGFSNPMFTGYPMAFYYAALAILYSSTQIAGEQDRKCPNGHRVSPTAGYCEACGQLVVNPPPKIE